MWHGRGEYEVEQCFDCGQDFHGVVRLALGWAAWKTYLARPETDWTRCNAIGTLGSAILKSGQPDDAILVLEASLALRRRYWSHDDNVILITQTNLAVCLDHLGRHDEALVLQREIYASMWPRMVLRTKTPS